MGMILAAQTRGYSALSYPRINFDEKDIINIQLSQVCRSNNQVKIMDWNIF